MGSSSNNELVQCLLATLSPEAHIRQQAENGLQEWSKHQGFCLRLLEVVQSNDLASAADVRQLAAVILRRHVEKNWVTEDVAPISDAEKAQVRVLLPASLAEPNSRIQTAIGVCIAEIGKIDCPTIWPELLPGLVNAVADKSNPHLVTGAVRCLALLSEDLSEEQVVEMAPVVLPELLQIVQSDAHPMSIRRWALVIFKTCLGALELVYRDSPSASQILQQCLIPWLQVISKILEVPTTAENPHIWGIKFEALGCLVRATRAFSKYAMPEMPAVLNSCWGTFTACAPLYDLIVVRAEGDDTGIEEDSSLERVTFSDLVSQLFELLMTLLGSAKLLPMLRPAFQQLAYLCVGYMQVSEENIERWNADVNEYLSNEDDFWGTRASGEMLLDEMIESGKKEGLAAIGEAVQHRIEEANAAKQAGNEYWWRLKEAALLAAGAVADRCVEFKRRGKALPPALDPEVAATELLNNDLTPQANSPPFLLGRALCLLSKWTPALSSPLRSAVLRVACPALAPTTPPLVQAGACQAVARLLKNAAPEDIQAVSEHTYIGLSNMLPTAEEDSLHLILGTLTALIKADAAGAARFAPQIIPSALKVWVDNIADPFIGEDAENLLRALAAAPGCLPALQQTAVPTLCGVISNPGACSPLQLSGCIDMLTLVLQPSSKEAAAAICGAALQQVLLLLSTTDDEDVAESCGAFLRTALQVGSAEALAWGGQDAASGALAFIQAAKHLLKPEIPDVACSNVGGLILELLRQAGAAVAPHMADILIAVACKLPTVDAPMPVQSLISVLAQVALSDASQLVEVLSKADAGVGDGSSALHVAMTKWTERHMEIRTPYDIKLSMSGLGALLACPHPALDAVVVKGKRIDSGSGIRTRSRAVKQAEQWSQVPLRVKLVMLLADSYIEAQTQGASGGMDDWEEEEFDEFDDDDDEEEDEEEEEGGGGAGGFSKWDEYGMLNGGFEEDDFDFFGDDLAVLDPLENARRENDPLNSMDVAGYVASAFKELAQSSPALMQAAAAELTETQVQAVQRIWQG